MAHSLYIFFQGKKYGNEVLLNIEARKTQQDGATDSQGYLFAGYNAITGYLSTLFTQKLMIQNGCRFFNYCNFNL